ncbi:MAG TPA: response regulator [Hyphomicrobiaceae bacterium]|nr:response regulator [Hyphomicrobiaceae bacterium]
MRLLLLEDNARLQAVVSDSLRTNEYLVDAVGTIASFRSAIALVRYDLFIIDLGLPDGDGLALIRELRAGGCEAPILVITAQAAIDARVSGLEGGADDYLVKPFHQAELLARIRALLRRPQSLRTPMIEVGSLKVDSETGEARVKEHVLDLRLRERRLLILLARRAGSVVAKSVIEAALTDFEHTLSGNAIEVIVYRLRKALDDKASGVTIVTVRGVGYVLRETQA